MKKLAITIIATAAISAANTDAQTTQRLTADRTNEYGLIYTLPSTVIDITMRIERTVKRPGEFNKYAKKYLNIAKPITKTEEYVTVTDAVINCHGEADAEKKYIIQFKSGSSPFINIDGNNSPLSINTDETIDISFTELPEAPATMVNPLETPAAHQAITQEMIQSSSSAKRAELAAARIYELREARNEIISGQSDQSFPDGEALRLALDNLSAQEAALVAMFAGTTTITYEERTISYTPGDEDVTDKVIARISPTDGFIPVNNLAGEPVYLSMHIDSHGELPVNEKGVVKSFPKGGLAYTIPGKATFKVKYDNRTIASGAFDIAQLGVTFGLDPGLFSSKKTPAFAIFNPATGAIVTLGTNQ